MTAAIEIEVRRGLEVIAVRHFPPARVVTVGRDPGCDLILESPEISRHHAEIELAPDDFAIHDRSLNGTRHAGQRLGAGQRLAFGATVEIGSFALSLSRPAQLARARSLPATKARLLARLIENVELAALERSADELRPRVEAALERMVHAEREHLPLGLAPATLIAELSDEALGLGPLEQLLSDDEVSEIMVVEPRHVYAERRGQIARTALAFTSAESLRTIIDRILTPLGRRLDEASPMVDARLADGSRVNAIIPPLAVRGPCLTIRKFARTPLTIDDLIRFGSLDRGMAAFLERAVRARCNIVISGGTGSGKTTLLNVLAGAIPPTERIVTIEDAAELRLPQEHVVPLESRPPNAEGRGRVSIRDLVRNALRMRPDRIVVGECRGGEALDMLQAMNTGHDGSLTTTHANSPAEAIARLETLSLMAGLDLPARAIREQIAAAVDLIVQQTRLADGTRRISSIAEVGGLEDDGRVRLHEIYRYVGPRASGGAPFLATGWLPSFVVDAAAAEAEA